MTKKIFVHVDMNAFFASIEQRDYPDLLGKPIAVTNGQYGSCIITSSYEARAFGIKTGMKIREGRKICPHLIQRSSRPKVYAATSERIMNILASITPDIQIYSVDEAFLELTNCMKIYKEINHVVYKIKDLIYQTEHLKCSIGISFSKSLAKYASKINKPDGTTTPQNKRFPGWRCITHSIALGSQPGANDGGNANTGISSERINKHQPVNKIQRTTRA